MGFAQWMLAAGLGALALCFTCNSIFRSYFQAKLEFVKSIRKEQLKGMSDG